MSLHTIAVDDDPVSLKIIEKLSGEIPNIDLRVKFDNALDAMVYVNKHKPDLVILDIDMPDINGIDFAKKLKGTSMVIFATGYKEFAIQAFSVNALDYLTKPLNRLRFHDAVHKAHNMMVAQKLLEKQESQQSDMGNSITIKVDYKKVQLRQSEILYVEALDNYVKIHTSTQVYLTLQNLKSISDVLDHERFLRVHRSYIIALQKIEQFSSNKVLINGNRIPVGRKFLPEFRRSIKN